MAAERRNWRWTNVPVPEPHLIVGGTGVILGVVWPLTIDWDGVWAAIVGIALIASGVGLMGWATAAAGRVRLANPDRLVTDGPYSISRHPMYMAWTFVYLGAAVVIASAWLLILLPVLGVWVHVESGREERRLVETFGSAYTTYQSRVRRYL